MAELAPAEAEYAEYIPSDPLLLKRQLLESSRNHFYWRKDAKDRIPGGRKRTFIPDPNGLLDSLFLRGDRSFRDRITPCMRGANMLMRDMGAVDWRVNRVVLNLMPPGAIFKKHTDPSSFRDGVVTVGLGGAAITLGNQTITTEGSSLMVIPPSLPHSVRNQDETRISIALICDTRLESGESVIYERIKDSVLKYAT